MVCLGIEPGAAGWKARTNPLSYGGTPQRSLMLQNFLENLICYKIWFLQNLICYKTWFGTKLDLLQNLTYC